MLTLTGLRASDCRLRGLTRSPEPEARSPDASTSSTAGGCARSAIWRRSLPAELSARLGQTGLRWQRWARGEEMRPLVPAGVAESFEESLDLEWPIDGLEPLSFVLARLFEPLCDRLERGDRGAVVLRVTLTLVTGPRHSLGEGGRDRHERVAGAPGADARCARAAHAGAARSRVEPAAGGDRSRRRRCRRRRGARPAVRVVRARAAHRHAGDAARAARRAHGQRPRRRAGARRHLSSRRLRDGEVRSTAQLYESPVPHA